MNKKKNTQSLNSGYINLKIKLVQTKLLNNCYIQIQFKLFNPQNSKT
jgi:hypothetical protein